MSEKPGRLQVWSGPRPAPQQLPLQSREQQDHTHKKAQVRCGTQCCGLLFVVPGCQVLSQILSVSAASQCRVEKKGRQGGPAAVN